MTAEELLKLIREANSWDLGKSLRVFDGEGIYSYLVNHDADSFAEKVKNERGLTVDDLQVGDIITCGNTRYVVLAIENDIQDDDCGAYIFDGEQTAYIINCGLEDFKKTSENVAYYVKHIVNALNLMEDDNPF